MSLGGSINHFYRKYKKPLIIIVLVFFVYKVFSYYGNVYEGFDGTTGPSSAELRVMANDARNRALEANTRRQMAEQYLLTLPDQASQQAQFARESIARATAKANEMNLEADRLDTLVIEAEAAEVRAATEAQAAAAQAAAEQAATAAAQAAQAQAQAAQAQAQAQAQAAQAQAQAQAAVGAGAAALRRMGRKPLRLP
jgi:hypothetical protein